jgi:hypothetical protein
MFTMLSNRAALSEVLAVRITPALRRELDELLQARPEYSRGGVVRRALSDWLKNERGASAER